MTNNSPVINKERKIMFRKRDDKYRLTQLLVSLTQLRDRAYDLASKDEAQAYTVTIKLIQEKLRKVSS